MRRITIGLAVMLVSEAGMLLKIEPFWSWHTPIAWTGYIAFADGAVYVRRGTSWLSNARAEFAFLALVSIPLWLVFEFYDLFIHNWHYVNLPESALLRDAGYAWAFATIWPAIFETAELVGSLRERRGHAAAEVKDRDEAGSRERRSSELARHGNRRSSKSTGHRFRGPAKLGPGELVSIVVGAAFLVWPIARPSPYLAAPVWLGFIFLLDPVNAHCGGESLLGDYRRGRIDRAVNLALGGLACGVLWEFWNYWSRTKWIYSVPILEHVKLFEMPLPGYLGFPAFALECFAMYVTIRLLLWRGSGRPVGL
jgi:hypothetical protein